MYTIKSNNYKLLTWYNNEIMTTNLNTVIMSFYTNIIKIKVDYFVEQNYLRNKTYFQEYWR